MIDFVKTFKELVKVEKIHTDNNVFKLHYRISVMMLVIFSILLTSKQCFGDPIICEVESTRKEVIDLFCWIKGTYVINDKMEDKFLPGFGIRPQHKSEQTTQKYYQWVAISFCVQALLFYFPRYLWKSWEGGRLRLLLQDLTGPMLPSKWDKTYREKLVKYVVTEKQTHLIYFWRYTLCEFLNIINVIGQILWLDWFINGHFSLYGVLAITHNVMDVAFPKIGKCDYYRYGYSGTREERDALCVLSLNVLNEKLFLILWFWLYFLLAANTCALTYRVFFITVPKFRMYLLRAQARNLDEKKAKCISEDVTYGAFFLMYKIGKNVNPVIYNEIVSGIHDNILGNTSYRKYECNLDV